MLKVAIVLFGVACIVVLLAQLVGGGGGRSKPKKPVPLPDLPDEPGYRAADPFDVKSVAVVEARAKRLACRRCGDSVRVDDHVVERFEGELLRVVATHCKQNGHADRMFFRILATGP